jgi:hypothetical protein
MRWDVTPSNWIEPGVDFYTECKCVTSRWFTEGDKQATRRTNLGG